MNYVLFSNNFFANYTYLVSSRYKIKNNVYTAFRIVYKMIIY